MRAIVFSKNRPMQLDLLLTSLSRNAKGLFDITVLWTGGEGYRICSQEHPEARFVEEDGLTYQVRALLREGSLVTFLTDDDVLYRPLTAIPYLPPNVICFSLRLGMNTNYCYPLARSQRVPEKVAWLWEQEDGDFGYPMSLDGHIFRASDLIPVLGHFTTPNWLEVMLMKAAPTFKRPYMTCFSESRLVGLPLNRVQDEMPNRNGGTYSVQELNQRYLRGERIDLDALDFSDIHGAHQEIPLVFR